MKNKENHMKKYESHLNRKPTIEKNVPIPPKVKGDGDLVRMIQSMEPKDCAVFSGLDRKAKASVASGWITVAKRHKMKVVSRSLSEPGGTFTLRLWRVK
jgi:hypothetical protein